MKRIKTVERSINNLKDIQLGIAEMSDLVGGKCLVFGSFILPGGCACDKRDFLAIGEVGTNGGKNNPNVPNE